LQPGAESFVMLKVLIGCAKRGALVCDHSGHASMWCA